MAKIKKDGRIGELVMVNGKHGSIVEVIGESAKIKFDDGSFIHVDLDQVTQVDQESYSKVLVCPICKNAEITKQQGEYRTDDRVFSCKCGQIFSAQVKGGEI